MQAIKAIKHEKHCIKINNRQLRQNHNYSKVEIAKAKQTQNTINNDKKHRNT